jgi:hypothetical protein
MKSLHVATGDTNYARRETPYEEEFLVHKGAVGCLAPLSGSLPPGHDRRLRLFTNWRVTLMGPETVAKIIFDSDDTEPILGIVAFEHMGDRRPDHPTLCRLHAKP